MKLLWDFMHFFKKNNTFDSLPANSADPNPLNYHEEVVFVIRYLLEIGRAIRVGSFAEGKYPVPLFKHSNIGNEAMDSISNKRGKMLLDDGIQLKQQRSMKILMRWMIKNFPELKTMAEKSYACPLDADKQPVHIIVGAAHRIKSPQQEKTHQHLQKLIYFSASFLFVMTAVAVYAKNPARIYYALQSLLALATVISLTALVVLGAINKLRSVLIWFILKTILLGLLLLFYFYFFPNNALHGRLAATVAISPLILLLLFNTSYLLIYTLRKSLASLDKKYHITYVLMRPLRRYRKNFMRLLELRWFFAAGSFAILAVANLYLLLPSLDFIVR